MAQFRISVRLDADTRRRLGDIVTATGKSESELVREALAAFLKKHRHEESCLDLATRHRLIGCATRLPADLSTNRKYLDGLGR